MGKATIISNNGQGAYRVAVNYERTKLDAMLAEISSQRNNLEIELAELRIIESDAKLAAEQAAEDLDIAIIFYAADQSKENGQSVKKHTSIVKNRRDEYVAAKSNTSSAELKLESLKKREVRLNNAIQSDDPEVDAWCADFSVNLAGEVGLIEPGLVEDSAPVIVPAGTNGDLAAYDSVRDGALLAQPIMSPAASYYNNAMLAATNKWKPRYRKGIITAKDGDDRCTVSLAAYPISSTSQNLNINQSDSVDASIEYMSCNGAIFAVDDHVIVAFMANDWADPVVIGFVNNPKPCFFGFGLATGITANAVRSAQYMDGPATDGTPWAISEYAYGDRPLYGNIDWRGEDGEILTFHGYNRYMGFVSKYPDNLNNSDRLSNYIYKDGKVLVTTSEKVSGVCISGDKLFYVTHSFYGGDKFYFADLDDLGNPRLVHTEPNFYQDYFPVGPWLMDAQGVNGTTRRLSADGVQINRYHLYIFPDTESVTITDKGQNDWTSGTATSWDYSKMTLEDFDGNRLTTGSLEVVGTVETSGVDAYNEMMYGMAYLGIEPAIGSSGSMSVDHKSRTVIIMDGQILVDEILFQDKYAKSWVVVEYQDIPGYDWLCEFTKEEAPRISSAQVIKWMDMRGPFLAFDAYTETWDAQMYEYALSDSKHSTTGGVVSQDKSTYAKSVIVSPAYNRSELTFMSSVTFNVDRYTNWGAVYQYPTKYNESDISQHPTAHGEPPIVYAELVFRQVVVYEKYGNAVWYRDDKTKIMFSFIIAKYMPTAVSNRQMADVDVQNPDGFYEYDEYITDADFETLIPINGKSHIGVI